MTIYRYTKNLTGWRAAAVATCMLTVIGVGTVVIIKDALVPAGISVVNYASAHFNAAVK